MPRLAAIEPKTSADLDVVLKQDGIAETGGTVTASIYDPLEELVVENVPLAHQGSGVFRLLVLPAWSTGASNEAIEGIFTAEVTAIAVNLKQRVRRFTYNVFYN